MRTLVGLWALATCTVPLTWNHGLGAPDAADWTAAEPSAAKDGVTNFTCLKDKICVARTSGRWWVGTFGGLVEMDDQTFRVRRVHTPADGLAGTRVFGLAADGSTLWAGTSGGISRLDTTTGGIVNIPAVSYRWRFEPDEDRRYIWALCQDSAVCCERSSGRYRRFRMGESLGEIVREGATLWGAGRGRIVRLDTTTGQRTARELSIPDARATSPRLVVGPRELWALAGEDSRRGGRLLRLDKMTLQAQLHGVTTGLAHDDVQDVLVVGDDVWLRTAGEWDDKTHVGIGAQLCRYHRASDRWQVIPPISGSKHDEPTCLAELDGDLWVATRAYDRMEEMVVAWGMMPMKREAPVIKALAVNRFDRDEGAWQTFPVPRATNYDRIISLTLRERHLWFLLERKPLAASWEERRNRREKHCVVPGYVDIGSPQPKAVLMGEPTFGPVWDPWLWGRKAIDLFVRGDVLCLQRITRGRSQLWQCAGGKEWRGIEFDGPLSDPREMRLFTVGECALAACVAGALRFEPQGERWLPWSARRPWSVTDVCRDRHGTWWLAATFGQIDLPADSERNDEDRQPLQSGLFRSRDGSSWAVPDIAPWTWHQQDVAGEVRFLPLAQVQRIPRDLELWGQTALSFPRRGARRVAQTKTGEGVCCVQSDGERVWAGTLGEGVFCLENKRWRRLWPKSALQPGKETWFVPRAAEDTVTSMALDGDSLWIATLAGLRRCRISGGAVAQVDGSSLGLEKPIELHRTSDPLYLQRVGPTVSRVAQRIWFWPGGDHRGLYLLHKPSQVWKRVLADVQPRCLGGDGEILWIGTAGGLVRYNTRTRNKRSFTVREGLLCNVVDALAIDDRSVWVGTRDGISRLDRARFEKQ